MKKSYLIIKNRNLVKKIYPDEIFYIMRDGRKLLISSRLGKYSYYEKIENVSPLLGGDFFMLLKGVYINFKYVNEIKENKVFFENGETLYLGNNGFIRAKRKFYGYLIISKKIAEGAMERNILDEYMKKTDK